MDFFLHSSSASAIGLPVCERDLVTHLEDNVDGNARSKHVVATPTQTSAALEGNPAVIHQKLAADEALGLILLWKVGWTCSF